MTEQSKTKDSATDLAQALMQIPKLVSALDAFTLEKQREVDSLATFTAIDLDVKSLTAKTDVNLKQTADLKAYVVQRLKAVDSLEAKWNLLISRVDGVLQALERELNR